MSFLLDWHLLNARSDKEKKYAHYIGQASWAGARIIQGQWTPFALKLYDLLILVFSESGKLGDLAALKQKSGVTDADWEDILQYTSQVSNLEELKHATFLILSSCSILIGPKQPCQLQVLRILEVCPSCP